MTTLDDRQPAAVSADLERACREAFLSGYTLGHRHGIEDAEAHMADSWAVLARRVRQDAGRLAGPVPEPVTRSQPDDSIWFRPDEWAALTKEAR